MRTMPGRIVVIALVLSVGIPALPAQDQEAPSQSNDSEPILPPGPKKSVEIGNFYLKKKKYNAALSRFQEAVASDATFAPAYLGLGRTYEKIGLKRKALDAYREYLDLLPSAKDAEEAKQVHRAIDRLDSQAKNRRSPPGGRISDAGGASEPH